MKFARIVERGNRQVLMAVSPAPEGEGYSLYIETHYRGLEFLSIHAGRYTRFDFAYKDMMELSEDDVIDTITKMIEAVSEEEDEQ